MVNDEWAVRVESKLDRIAENQASEAATNKATRAKVEDHDDAIKDLKSAQDRQKGRADLLVTLSLLAVMASALIEGVRLYGGR